MTPRNMLIAMVLLAAVVASWLLLDRRTPAPQSNGPLSDSGYYLRDAVIEGAGEDGRRLYTLSAERILQNPVDNSVALEDVTLEYLSPDAEPWRLRANNGAIPADGESISLSGDVKIHELIFAGPDQTTVTAPELDIDLRAHFATTDTAVRIERGNYLITATGMRANLRDRQLKLESDVHGRFLP